MIIPPKMADPTAIPTTAPVDREVELESEGDEGELDDVFEESDPDPDVGLFPPDDLVVVVAEPPEVVMAVPMVSPCQSRCDMNRARGFIPTCGFRNPPWEACGR
jgi:hypothetical protein